MSTNEPSSFVSVNTASVSSSPLVQSARKSVKVAAITVDLLRPAKGSLSLKLLVNGRDFIKLPLRYHHEAKNTSTSLSLRWPLNPYFTLQRGSELSIQVRRRRNWPKNIVIAEASVELEDLQHDNSKSSEEPGKFQQHKIHNNPAITLDIVVEDNALRTGLQDGITKSADVKSILDHLGKSRRFLGTLMSFGVALSELQGISKAILACINVIYEKLCEQDRYDGLILELVENMARTLDFIEDVEQFARIIQLKKTLEDVRPLMEDTTNFILKFTSRSTAAQLFNTYPERDKIDKLTERFRIFQQQFDRGLAIQSGSNLEALLGVIMSSTDDKILNELRPRGLENSDIMGGCMRGTREDVFYTVDKWVNTFMAPNILWIRGFPGVGKSAIATSIVEMLRASNRLGSSFVFERAKATIATPNALWRSVAFDLSRLYPTVRKVVVQRITDEDVDVHTSNVKTLFKNIIEEPLLESIDIPTGRLPVIIIDALDECGGRDGRQSVHREGLLSTLKRWAALPSQFKLIVTGRGEDDLVRVLSPLCVTIDLSSGNTVSPEASEDIRLFLTARFAKITKGYPDSLVPNWPGPKIIDELTTRAAGLFIWAKTVTTFVNSGEPNGQLRQIVDGGVGLGDMSILYTRVLDVSFRLPSIEVLESFHAVAGAMIFAKRPLTRTECIELLGIEPSMLDFLRKGLHSLIDSGDTLRFSHQSFVEFLLDSSKCPLPFLIDGTTQNRNLATSTLRILNEALRFNIAQLSTSYLRNNDIIDLPERIQKFIPSHLLYSCRFWADHLQVVPFHTTILSEVKLFFYERFLFWLEVLSLVNDIHSVNSILTTLVEWREDDDDEEFYQFLMDCYKFLAAFGGVVSQSAPHIYLSALPFAPENSKVAQLFRPLYPGTLSLESGRLSDWPAILFVIEAHDSTVNSVVFSPDGRFILSASSDKTISIWDAETGDLISGPFEGHGSSVNCAAFSLDGRLVASGSDDLTIRIWDSESGDELADPLNGHTNVVTAVSFTNDGRCLVSGSLDQTIRVWDVESGKLAFEPIIGHDGGVTSIALSEDNKYIASGSLDRTIRVWNMVTGNIAYGPFEGHRSWVNCVSFSPDGSLIASASDDETIRLWDLGSSEAFADPLEFHTDGVTSVAFSRDGRKLVSGSHDETILIWDVKTGAVISEPFTGHTNGIMSVDFSWDGKRILSGARDWTVRVWDAIPAANSIELALSSAPILHTDGINSVAFSPDGHYIASGSDDDTVRHWDSLTGQQLLTFRCHTSWIDTIAFSCDGKYIASGSDDQTICIWEAEAGALLRPPLEGHRAGVTTVVFSPDGRRLISGSYDKTIRVWEVSTGLLILGPIQPHSSWVTCVAISSDGKWIASASYDRTIKIIDANTGFPTSVTFVGHTGAINCIVFSGDAQYVASSSADSTIRVWDVNTGKLVRDPLNGHTNLVVCLAFSPDDSLLASGSNDRTIRIWDVATGTLVLGPFEGHIGGVLSLAFSMDGERLVSGSEDETIRIWDLSTHSLSSNNFESKTPFSDSCSFHNGWVISQDDSLLFWVPPWNRTGLWWPRNIAVIAEVPTKLRLGQFRHGSLWYTCSSVLPNLTPIGGS
ncbi:WD40-repeat-containing domain protein [Crucibulum laeve]|uniref:WD40-repeat-containing domain protein n=1 Tax=Crucibulum laeve TaxID=68775 RepID=A0A5C3LYK9_9AGAR|nr:WD40-repeat-containing domain protein [Crucibulum laeve]